MRRAVILGAGGFGREVLAYALESGQWNIIGFLDANPRALDHFGSSVPILGDPVSVKLPNGALVLCAIADPKTKLYVCRALVGRGAEFGTLIHPSAVVGTSCRVGVGGILGPYCTLTSDVSLGDFVTVNAHSSIGHDAVIGDGCTLSGHCDVTGGAVLGQGVFMGTHAAVIPRVRVGDYAVISAGSVAMWPVRANSTVMGVPAVRMSIGRREAP